MTGNGVTTGARTSPQRVTLAEIARTAGVSSSTASFALSGHSGTRVAASTRDRVLEVARTLGYVPRRHRPPGSRTTLPEVGFVSDTVASDAYAGALIRGASDEAAEQGRLLLVVETGGAPEAEADGIERLLELGVRDVVVGATGVWRRPVPTALVGHAVVMLNCYDPSTATRTVLPDDHAAGREVAGELLGAGHTDRIWAIGAANTGRVAGNHRLQGLVAGLAEQGARLAGAVECPWLPMPARDVAEQLLSRPGQARPTALVALNDRIALGVYQAVARLGLTIPDDVSVISFDDTDLAAWLEPGLTSLRLPYYAMGRQAVSLLLDGVAGPTRLTVPLTVTHRESVGPPPLRSRGTARSVPAARAARAARPAVAGPPPPAPLVAVAACGLDELPAVGRPAVRSLRTAGFGSLARLAGAAPEALLALDHVGPTTVRRLQRSLQMHGLALGAVPGAAPEPAEAVAPT